MGQGLEGLLSRRELLTGAAAMAAYAALPGHANADSLSFGNNSISVERAITNRPDFQTERKRLIELLNGYITSPYGSERKRQSEIALSQEPYGITGRHTSRITEANEKLMPWGLFLTERFGDGHSINVFDLQSTDIYRAVAHGKHIGDYNRVILGRKLFYTGAEMPPVAGFDRIAGKHVIFIPYSFAKYGTSQVPLEKLFDTATMHELGHLKFGFEGSSRGEEGAILFEISSSFDGKSRIESEEDIVKILDKENEPTRDMRYVISSTYGKYDYSEQARLSIKNYSQGVRNVQKKLKETAEKINVMNPKYPVNHEKWSDQQFVAMGFLRFMRFLEENPKYRIKYDSVMGNGMSK